MKRFLNQGTYKLLIDSVENGDNVSVFGLNLGEKLALVEDSAFLFYVVESLEKINDVQDKLTMLGRNCEVLTDTITPLTSEFINIENYVKVLSKLKNKEIDTVIITPEVLAGQFPEKSKIKTFTFKVGSEINITEFIKNLTNINYKRVDLVSNPAEFSVRGDIIDIYPIGYNPTRIYVDFDTIESIKLYNPVTMLTTSELDSVYIVSNKYFDVSEEDIKESYKINKL